MEGFNIQVKTCLSQKRITSRLLVTQLTIANTAKSVCRLAAEMTEVSTYLWWVRIVENNRIRATGLAALTNAVIRS